MRKTQEGIFRNIDWLTVIMYLLLVTMGWISIYASVYNEEHQLITDLSQKYGKQMIWIGTSLVLALIILIVDGNFYAAIAWPLWIVVLISLVAVLFLGTEISGSKSWLDMVVRILSLKEAPKPVDSTDALALAICNIWRGSATSKIEDALRAEKTRISKLVKR